MKFKLCYLEEPLHKGHATCVGWSNTDVVFTCGDDNTLYRWNVSNHEQVKVVTFRHDIMPTDLQWIPHGPTLSKHNEIILLTGATGKFYIVNRNGRIERTVDAHKGAILIGKWTHDGSGLLTAGEDGKVKIWSKGGMLRSVLVKSETPVYSASWSSDSQTVAYAQGRILTLKRLQPNTKPIRWRAHQGLILSVAWGPTINSIVSGSEDGRYKVWNPQGRLLYQSGRHGYPITTISWAPQGDLFVIGAYNTMRLCNAAGFSHCLEKIDVGSIYNIGWSTDGTQLAAACSSGHILFAHIIDRFFQQQSLTARMKDKKRIIINDILTETHERLDFPERIIKVAIAYNHLVATTPTKVFIYTTTNWNTPHIFNLRDGIVSELLLAEKYLAIIERSKVYIYSYQGRLILTPKWPGMNPETLHRQHIAISSDTLIICDQKEHKNIHIYELVNMPLQDTPQKSIRHQFPIQEIALNQVDSYLERQLALVDTSLDLYIVAVRGNRILAKITSQIHSFRWNVEYNILAVIQDTRLVVWYTPAAAYFSQPMLRRAAFYYDGMELGRAPKIIDFNEATVIIRRVNGSVLTVPIATHAIVLHDHVMIRKWTDAIKLCRLIQEPALWASLAVLATQARTDAIGFAIEAYTTLHVRDIVAYLQYVKSHSLKPIQLALVTILGGSFQEGEKMLLQNSLVYQAIITNIELHNWNRALELSIRHKTHIDTVMYLRQKYLEKLKKDENNSKFITLTEGGITIDENKVIEKMQIEALKHKKPKK